VTALGICHAWPDKKTDTAQRGHHENTFVPENGRWQEFYNNYQIPNVRLVNLSKSADSPDVSPHYLSMLGKLISTSDSPPELPL
jgi:hypothetical protein